MSDSGAEGGGNASVDLVACSVRLGDPVQIVPIAGLDATGVEIWRAGEFEDMFRLRGPLELDSSGMLTCSSSAELESGIYLVVAITLRPPEGAHRLDAPPIYRPDQATIFEVVDRDPIEDPQQVSDSYQALVRGRQAKLAAGIGEGSVECGALVFVKDIYMTEYLHGGSFEVVPTEPVGWSAEVSAMQSTLAALGYPPVSVPDVVTEQVEQAEPSLVIRFPVIRGESVDRCAELAEKESASIINVLALMRGSLGAPFAVVAFDPSVGQVRFRVCTPRYTGNHATGWLSGEDPEDLRGNIAGVRSNATLEFYTVLLAEAIREPRTEFKYVRFWSLLETIGRSRSYIGTPLRDWAGNVRRNARGVDRSIQDSAKEIVFELARDLLAPASFGGGGGFTYPDIDDQLTIAYRRRNCTAHGSPCLCRGDSTNAHVAQYQQCKSARQDESVGVDPYLTTLQLVAEGVVGLLLRNASP